jgi:hypothetical protein
MSPRVDLVSKETSSRWQERAPHELGGTSTAADTSMLRIARVSSCSRTICGLKNVEVGNKTPLSEKTWSLAWHFAWWAVTGSNRRPLRCKRISGRSHAGVVVPAQRPFLDVFAGQALISPCPGLDLVGLLAASGAPHLLHDLRSIASGYRPNPNTRRRGGIAFERGGGRGVGSDPGTGAGALWRGLPAGDQERTRLVDHFARVCRVVARRNELSETTAALRPWSVMRRIKGRLSHFFRHRMSLANSAKVRGRRPVTSVKSVVV